MPISAYRFHISSSSKPGVVGDRAAVSASYPFEQAAHRVPQGGLLGVECRSPGVALSQAPGRAAMIWRWISLEPP